MGMDVFGQNPTSTKGEYFRNNIWWWHPLWDFCSAVAPEICDKVEHAHSNDGDGLDELDSVELSKRLFTALKDGTAKQYIKERNDYIKSLPKRKCSHCMATGMRLWYKNTKTGETRNPYEYDIMADILGDGQKLPKYKKSPIKKDETEISDTCNGCGGKGETEPNEADYSIDEKNIREFANFLKACGGFQIC
jgi:hypothetical protein